MGAGPSNVSFRVRCRTSNVSFRVSCRTSNVSLRVRCSALSLHFFDMARCVSVGQRQRQWRRDCPRPPARVHWRAYDRHPPARAQATRPKARRTLLWSVLSHFSRCLYFSACLSFYLSLPFLSPLRRRCSCVRVQSCVCLLRAKLKGFRSMPFSRSVRVPRWYPCGVRVLHLHFPYLRSSTRAHHCHCVV